MSKNLVIARQFRPQKFSSVFGQEAVVSTLKNAIKLGRVAQAYLFCGPRGTGKTTLARLFAKAINCSGLEVDGEPCGNCISCREITNCSSLDVIEIDGASNRGIDDIRKINETVGYSSARAATKVYIIDEVHMLTKEAFNALLKTLEEPPAHVVFIFATTEPHKVLPTILSRCQRFNLNRISTETIAQKLAWILDELKISAEKPALLKLAEMAEGGLRDAESMLDQTIAYCEQDITLAKLEDLFGITGAEVFFQIDEAVASKSLQAAFSIANQIYSSGKDLNCFIESLISHYRQILSLKLKFGQQSQSQDAYAKSCQIYTQEECLELIEYLINSIKDIKESTFPKISLEITLLHIMQTKNRVTIDKLITRLQELEVALHDEVAVETKEPVEIAEVKVVAKQPVEIAVVQPKAQEVVNESLNPTEKSDAPQNQSSLCDTDTLMHFAAAHLQGKLKKN